MLELRIYNDELKQANAASFCLRLLRIIRAEIFLKANRQKYKVREPIILSIDFIKWNSAPPKTIDLFYYIADCLVLEKTDYGYIIKVNDKRIIPGSTTLIKDLVRLLEYGCALFPPYPLIRDILSSVNLYIR